ncbi:MAG: hypothetical protein ACYTFQ_04430 [Planctomycetota bacterium]|jgi:hypothetical protein
MKTIYILHRCRKCGETFRVPYEGNCFDLEDAIVESCTALMPEFHPCDLDEALGIYPVGLCEVVGGFEE